MADTSLSQAEIDQLLNGDSGNTEAATDEGDPNAIRDYDPTTQRRVVRERLQALEIINERFARQFRMAVFNLLRRSPDITVESIDIQPYQEFARNMPVPTNLNLLHMKPLRGTALIVFSPSLVFIVVDNLFGGDGRFPTKVEGREFTYTEQRVIRRLLSLALDNYQEAWQAIYPLTMEYVRSELQVKFTNITTSPNDIVINTTFQVEISNLVGHFNICIPFSMIEPLRELLVNPPLENSQQEDCLWRENLVNEVQQSPVEVTARLTELSITLRQIMGLQVGDVLAIESPENIIATVDNVPVFTASHGIHHDQYALSVNQLITPLLSTLQQGTSHE